MYIHNLNPVLLDLGFFEIRWYSLAYIFGILFGWWLGKKIFKKRTKDEKIILNVKIFDDLISNIVISIILGGRLGYVLFYNFEYYLTNPINIIKIWEGGMSFHGALIGIIFGTYIFSIKRKIKTLFLLDIIACVAPIGLFFGRISNFINAELYGNPSSLSWSVIFPSVDNVPRHPSQIYEAILEGLVLFLILYFFSNNKKNKIGICSCLFLILYGCFRLIAEQFRAPDDHIGYLFSFVSTGSLLSFVMIAVGIILFLKVENKNENFKKNI